MMHNTEVNLVIHDKLPISLPSILERIVCITTLLNKILTSTYRMIREKN